jgi:sialate O-acetylesterase
MFKSLSSAICLVFIAFCSHATVILPALISDNMVLQQGMPVHIWGRASAGERIKVSVLAQNAETLADESGNWQLWLNPLASKTPVSLTVSGTNSIVVKNVLIGEVWFASGQSNMEWDVSQSNDAEKEIAAADFPAIRLFEAVKGISDSIQTEIGGRWVICTPQTIPHITAVGYFFARGLHQKLNVPLGLIEASWGATRCEAWTPAQMFKTDSRLNYWINKWSAVERAFPALQAAYQQKYETWQKEVQQARRAGTAEPAKPVEPQLLTKVKPSVIYNAVVAPLSHYTIRGVVWYQGENNAYKDEAFNYRYLFPAMIQGWRDAWGQGDFPFIFVQLSTLNKHPYWPVLRESQHETLKLRNTAMAVSYDVGDSTNAHYHNKQTVGKRLELAALKLVYNNNVEASGPVFRQMTFEGNKLRIWFDHADGLKPSAGQSLYGFEIAGAEGRLYPADAKIEGTTIVLSNPRVQKPAIARYAFKDAVVANLINSSQLPAVPFRTDVKDGI